MKLYRLRSLGSCHDLERIKDIIQTEKFWCSKFFEMNDPMEGVYHAINQSNIDTIYNEKAKRKICSFSTKEAFENPAMWGYYANGFQGIAIEIEITDQEKSDNFHKVQYIPEVLASENAIEILTRKLVSWEHEKEYRFIKDTTNNLNQIGKITKIYFGNPYGNITNSRAIKHKHKYFTYKECLERFLESKGISFCNVKIDGNKVGEG